jgi:flavodoxin
MKTLIIYESIHHGNTEKIAKAMAESLGADLRRPREIKIDDLNSYDLVGFGSGIYFARFHVSLRKFLDNLPSMSGKKAFVFCTRGNSKNGWARSFEKKMLAKGFDVVGSFECQGFDTWGPFKLIGGTGKGRPNKDDLAKARDFAKDLI